MAKILITGATGFVGSHILETLVNIPHEDIHIVAACRNPQKLIPGFSGEVRQGDLRDPAYLDRVLAGIDIICHAAGWSSFEKSGNTINQAYLEPTLDLINRAIEWRVSRFINLSSLYTPQVSQRNNHTAIGQPRIYAPMLNGLIAVEDYLRQYEDSRCQFINLRLGLYSGKRLQLSLLSLLLTRLSHYKHLPYITHRLGHLPLVDGRDIGQAFARAALAPLNPGYHCFNIAGTESPSHQQVMQFIQQQTGTSPMHWGLPSLLATPLLFIQSQLKRTENQPIITSAMLNMLKSDVINLQHTRDILGYDPEISWQASLLDTLNQLKNQKLKSNLSQSYRNLEVT